MFFKRKELSDQEIKDIIEKIKIKYKENHGKYGEKYFNIQKFYDRYYDALQKKVPVETFLEAEVLAIDDIIKKIEDDKASKTTVNKESSAINKIFDEYNERIKKYNKIFIHNNACEEIERLYGCLKGFYDKYFHAFYKINRKIYNYRIKELFNEADSLISNFILDRSKKLPPVFDEYKNKILQVESNLEGIQKAGHPVLQKAFILLSTLKKYLYSLKEEEKYLKHINLRLNNENCSSDNYIKAAKKELEQILHDFRLKGLE